MKQKNYIYGIRPVIEAIKSGKNIDKLLIQKGSRGALFNELNTLIRQLQIPVQYVPVEKLNRITRKTHQGVIGFISLISSPSIENILPAIYESGKTPLLLILDRITDVRNFGAIARTAECAGADAIIIPSRGSAQINADAIKTSAGALHKIPVCSEQNIKETIKFLKDSGVQLVACTEKADSDYYKMNFVLPTAIIMGSEENGISPAYLKLSDHNVSIPLKGEIESLNVSVATGIILYEAIKQRGIDY